MLNLVGDCPGDQIGVKLRLMDLKDVELNPLPDEALKAEPQLVNSLPSPPDDHARPGGVNGYRHLICLALNLHIGDGGFSTYGLDSLAELQVFV